jgi:hypothetical protein
MRWDIEVCCSSKQYRFEPCVFQNYLKIAFNMDRPIFLSKPPVVVGIPVLLATLLRRPLIPVSLFQEKENPKLFLNPNMISVFSNWLIPKVSS